MKNTKLAVAVALVLSALGWLLVSQSSGANPKAPPTPVPVGVRQEGPGGVSAVPNSRSATLANSPIGGGGEEANESREPDGGEGSPPMKSYDVVSALSQDEQDSQLLQVGVEVSFQAFRESLDEHLSSDVTEVSAGRLSSELWVIEGAIHVFRDMQIARAALRSSMGASDDVLWHSFWEWDGPCTCDENHGDLWENLEVSTARALFDQKHMRFREVIPPEMREGGF